ncbi:MAG: hypothetical protein Q7J27_01245 [Syntrophales bacterium]|nr:hypothetical protein [Syntrophales bacterium]
MVGTALEMYEVMDAENLDHLRDVHQELGMLRSLKETFQDNKIGQYCDYFIRICGAEIESVVEEIQYGREAIKGFKGILRGRSSNIESGDDAPFSENPGFDNQSKEPDPILGQTD